MLNKINTLLAELGDFLAKRKTVDELHRLSDRELSDIGISRCDIYNAVYFPKRCCNG